MALPHRPADGVAAWRLIAEELRREIADGVHPAGGRLPTEGELAERFAVHRNTVRQAIAALAGDGLVASRRGSGTFVTEKVRLMHRIGVRTRLSTSLAPNGDRAHGELLATGLEDQPPAAVAQTLRLGGRPALRLETRRRFDGMVLARTTHWFDAARVERLAEEFRRRGSITTSLAVLGIDDYVRTSTVVGARTATAAEAADLEVSPGSVVLAVRALDSLPDGTPLQAQLTCFRADRIELDVDHTTHHPG